MNTDDLALFAIDASKEFGAAIGRRLGRELCEHEEREFDNGEHKIRPLCNVRNRDVYVVQSLHNDAHQSPNDKLCRLLFFLGALRDASAAHVTAVIPYLSYARKDRKTKARDPVTTRYVAGFFESLRVDRVITMDVHNLAAYQNAFGYTTTEHLVATSLFAEHFANSAIAEDGAKLVAGSPDVGGVKRAELFRQQLSNELGTPVGSAFLQKQRSRGVLSGGEIVGDVSGKSVIFIDDMICSGSTLVRAARACREAGAEQVVAAATHGLFTGSAETALSDSALDKIVVTNTVPPWGLSKQFVADKVTVLDATPLFADAVKCMHTGGSIVGLLPAEE